MAYFDCIVGGSGKGNTVVVTCASEFAGQTITLAKTGKTYTKTCPSTSPYTVTFNGVENGTYTVSCTVSGETYSETVIVQDISAVLNYGFNWKAWVDTAQYLDSSDYSTLADVLADEEAVRELMLTHVCVDYLASVTSADVKVTAILNDNLCAKWINNSDYALDTLYANAAIATVMDTADKYGYGEWVIIDDTATPPTWGPKGNVPKMTDTTSPYGEVSVSSTTSTHYGWKAFDRGTTSGGNYWYTANGEATKYIQYKSVNPICVKRVMIESSDSGSYITPEVVLKGSNDGNTWDTIDTISISMADCAHKEANVTNSNYYLYHRLEMSGTTKVSGAQSNDIQINELQFYGRELSVSVPVMTSNTAPFGEAFATSSWDSNYAAWLAFDNQVQPRPWSSAEGVVTNQRVGYTFNNSTVIKWFSIRNIANTTTKAPKNIKLQYKDSNNQWQDASQALVNPSTASAVTVFTVDNSHAANSWAILCADNYGNTSEMNISEIQFFGLDYSEKEFEAGTTKKWLYDHGVELETITTTKTGTGFVTKDDSKIDLGLDNVSASQSGSFAATPSINLTSYSLMRCKMADIGRSNVSVMARLQTGDSTAYVDINVADASLPNNIVLDISSINTSKELKIGNNTGNADRHWEFSFNEWWLE